MVFFHSVLEQLLVKYYIETVSIYQYLGSVWLDRETVKMVCENRKIFGTQHLQLPALVEAGGIMLQFDPLTC